MENEEDLQVTWAIVLRGSLSAKAELERVLFRTLEILPMELVFEKTSPKKLFIREEIENYVPLGKTRAAELLRKAREAEASGKK
ncbi:MAG: hypothetical protein ACXQTL_06010 [Methanosarcinales archaeon]